MFFNKLFLGIFAFVMAAVTERHGGDDMQQRASGQTRTRATVARTMTKWYVVHQVSPQGAPQKIMLRGLITSFLTAKTVYKFG